MPMLDEDCAFDIPILLTSPANDSVNDCAASSTARKYQYLTSAWYEYRRSERAHVSDLKDVVLETVHEGARHLTTYPDSEMKVGIFEFLESLRPGFQSHADMVKAYQVVDEAYLGKYAFRLNSRLLLARVKKPENVVAVLTLVPHPTQLLYVMQEVNESNAQISRENIADIARRRVLPSIGATAAHRLESQTAGCTDAIYNYRPLELASPPITIYHPVFAKFLQMMAEPHEFTHEELDYARAFVSQAAAYHRYDCDRPRNQYMIGPAADPTIFMRTRLSCAASGEFVADGIVTTAEAHNDFPTVAAITEMTLEVGEGGCDPLAKAECDYAAIYCSEEARPVRQACCCPAFLIGMAGPNITVAGAVFADQLVAQPLTDYISAVPRPALSDRSPLDDASHRVATLVRALRVCVKDLEAYYSHVVDSISPPRVGPICSTGPPRPFQQDVPLQVPAMIGPHFTAFRDSAGSAVTLTYKARLAPHARSKAVFAAEAQSASGTTKVVVQFAYAYSPAAHALLARTESPRAPALRYCAFERSVGMWVVVKDYVEGAHPDDGLTDPAHVAGLRAAVMALHGAGLVHGNLRASHVLVVRDSVVLLDFDWCGRAGEARYPSDITLDGRIDWHPGVRRGWHLEGA